MVGSLLYFLFALLVLSLLIFIHELGHYFMARRVGMRVEAFGIGFGRPLYRWHYDGVEWRLNWLPFGGYVKIAGQDSDEEADWANLPPDTFHGRSPLDRMKVALAGPLANLLFGFTVFSLLWVLGGREKEYAEFSPIIGWVDTQSVLFKEGVRPGDEIVSYDDRLFVGSKDHLYGPLAADEKLVVRGNKVNYRAREKKAFEYRVAVYPHPKAVDKAIKTAGILTPASYLIYQQSQKDRQGLAQGSPLHHSGIESGDRVIWANGELLFGQEQLTKLINSDRALVTVERAGELLLRRVPRVMVQELRLDPAAKEEISDWQYEAGLQHTKLQKLFILPYDTNIDNVVQSRLAFIDKEVEEEAFPPFLLSPLDEPLLPGDRIVSIDSFVIHKADQLLSRLQASRVLLLVAREPGKFKEPLAADATNEPFFKGVDWSALQKIVSSLGSGQPVKQAGNLHLLNPIVPKTIAGFAITPELKEKYAADALARRRLIDAIDDPEQKAHTALVLDQAEQQLNINPPHFQDRKIVYNPSAWKLFQEVTLEIWRTLGALVTGSIGLKWITGPVGLLQIVQENAASSLKEGLFWVGAISVNLGILNLLPIPVLDGGTIAFSFLELITRRRMHPKTLERLVIPFALALIALFLFLTYNDISRMLSRFI